MLAFFEPELNDIVCRGTNSRTSATISQLETSELLAILNDCLGRPPITKRVHAAIVQVRKLFSDRGEEPA